MSYLDADSAQNTRSKKKFMAAMAWISPIEMGLIHAKIWDKIGAKNSDFSAVARITRVFSTGNVVEKCPSRLPLRSLAV